MIPVSDSYAPFTAIRRVGVDVRFGVIDVTAKPGASVTLGTGDIFGTGGAETIDDISVPTGKYAALEKNLWSLDGTYDILPDDLDTAETGVWFDAVSDENGEFPEDISVYYRFSGAVSTIGWSLLFDTLAGQYPTRVRCVAYGQNGDVMADVSFDTSAMGAAQYLPYQLMDYYAVRFYFNGTNEPYRRIRLVEVDFGLTEKHTANTVGEVSISYGLDLTSESLPARELTFNFDNSAKKYNLLDPSGIYEYLQKGQSVTAAMVVNGESVDMGEFTFNSATTNKSVIVPRIRCTDLVYALDRESYKNGRDGEIPLSRAVTEVIGRADVEVVYGPGVADRPVVLAIESKTKRREALRLLGQAAMCAVWTDRHNVVHMEDIEPGEPVREFTANDLYNFNGITVSEPLEVVEVEVLNPFLESEEPVIYTAGEGHLTETITNPCVAPSMGNQVAAWLLERLGRQKRYKVKCRCDPAVEIGDTVRIDDIFGNRGIAIVTALDISYNGSLSATMEAVGV